MSKSTKTWTLKNDKNTETAPGAIEIQEYVVDEYLNINHNGHSWIVTKNEAEISFESVTEPLHYLYSNSSDNGVRVGKDGNAKTNHWFKILGGYLINDQTNRFFGVSLNTNPHSWRSYTNYDGVIAGQTLKFYKKVCLPSNVSRITYSVGAGDTAPVE
jgi:hypothetical protein